MLITQKYISFNLKIVNMLSGIAGIFNIRILSVLSISVLLHQMHNEKLELVTFSNRWR